MELYEKIHPEGWKDYPDTTTPIEGDNLTHIEEGIYENSVEIDDIKTKTDLKNNIISVSLTSDLSGQTTNRCVPFNNAVTIGNKLSLSSEGNVLIGPGVSKVKVSATAFCDTPNTGGYLWGQIRKNSSAVGQMLMAGNTTYKSIAIPPVLINVTEGDEIKLYLDVITAGTPYKIRSQYNTVLTVEVVE